MERASAPADRRRRDADRCRNRTRAVRRWLLAALALALAGPAVASAGETAEPRIEVAPGIYLASASELGGESQPPPARSAVPTPLIVGGNTTTIARWPWQVSIGYLPLDPGNAFRNHQCGGTLVAPTVVVTAAHCMTLGQSRNFRPAEEFQVVSGRTKLSTAAGQEHEVADYVWFVDEDGVPLWDPETIEWDVVFLLLATSSPQETIKIAGADEAPVWAPAAVRSSPAGARPPRGPITRPRRDGRPTSSARRGSGCSRIPPATPSTGRRTGEP